MFHLVKKKVDYFGGDDVITMLVANRLFRIFIFKMVVR